MSSFEYHPNKFPEEYTIKIIVVQWPCADQRINHEENKHMYMYVDANEFLHDNLIDYEGNTRAFDYNNSDKWSSQFIKEVIDIANDPRTESPYILIDGHLSIVEELEARNLNFILVAPDTLNHAKELFSSYVPGDPFPNYMSNNRAFAAMWHFICKKSFQVLHTDEIFTNYLFKSNGIIDEATNRAMNIFLNKNKLVNGRDDNYHNSIIYEKDTVFGDLVEFTSSFNDKELVSEAEKMIKDIDYIAFGSQPDHDICDYEEEYPDTSDDDEFCD